MGRQKENELLQLDLFESRGAFVSHSPCQILSRVMCIVEDHAISA